MFLGRILTPIAMKSSGQLLCAALLLFSGAAHAQHVRDPRASFIDVPGRRAELHAATDPRLLDVISHLGSCITASPSIPPSGPMQIPHHYLSGNHGPVNPAETAADQVYYRFQRVVTDGANQFLLTGSHAEAACALNTLDRWAAAGALIDYDATQSTQSWFEAGWTLGSVSLAYSILQQDNALDPQTKARVVAWFSKAAHKLIASEPANQPPVNLHFWRALAATSVGILASDDQLYTFGVRTYQQAIAQIDSRGAFPLEMQRRERAIHYQTFALEPLVLIAELAQRQGLDLYAYSVNGRTLRDAIVFFGRAVDDPAILRNYTPDEQDLYSDLPDNFSWAEFYVHRFGSAGLPQSILTGIGMPTETTRLGGSTTLLAGRSQSIAPTQ